VLSRASTEQQSQGSRREKRGGFSRRLRATAISNGALWDQWGGTASNCGLRRQPKGGGKIPFVAGARSIRDLSRRECTGSVGAARRERRGGGCPGRGGLFLLCFCLPGRAFSGQKTKEGQTLGNLQARGSILSQKGGGLGKISRNCCMVSKAHCGFEKVTLAGHEEETSNP